MDLKLEPVEAQSISLRQADGAVVDAINLGGGRYRFLDVNSTKIVLEWPGKNEAKYPIQELAIDPAARRIYFDLCMNPLTGEIREFNQKAEYATPKGDRNLRKRKMGGRAPVSTPPVNDDCASALPIALGATAYDTTDATTDGPAHAGLCQFDGQTYNDIWYEYTSDCDGFLTVSTCNNAAYDTDLVIYEADVSDCADILAGLIAPAACNDDTGGCAGFTSELAIAATSGTTYMIRVGGFADGDVGTGTVTLSCTGGPDGDTCDDAQAVACNSSITVDNTNATDEASDPEFSCRAGGSGNGTNSLWFTFVADETSAFIDTNASTGVSDTLLAVYEGTCGSLTEIACSEDEGIGLLSELCIDGLTVGQTYYIQVANFSEFSATGDMTLTITCPGPCGQGPPDNDECATATSVLCNSQTTVDNTNATDDVNDPAFSCKFGGPGNGVGSIWFTFEATSETALVETNNSLVSDTIVAVYEGDCGNLVEIGCSEDEGLGLLSQLCLDGLTVGTTYTVQVASFSDSSRGVITLDVTCPSPCPPNDECEGAIDLGALPASVTFANDLATDDIVVPCGVVSGPFFNVWYKVTGTGNTITATTCNDGTEVSDTKISVFCADCMDRICVAGNDDDCVDPNGFLSTVSWCSQAGAEYFITVGNFDNLFTAPGRIQLDVFDDGMPCQAEVSCLPEGACCLDDGTCVIATADDCAAMGGDYEGDDTACAENHVADGSFEMGGSWTEFSSTFGSPVCAASFCGTGGGTGPRTGDFWVWFGGIAAPEAGSMSQDVTIPLAAETLEFYLEIPVSSGNGVDFMNVSIDGNQVFSVLENDAVYGDSVYELVSVSVEDFADGGTHTLLFDSVITGDDGMGNAALTNFFVDDVAINTVDVECRDCFTIDFSTDDNGDPLGNGQRISPDDEFGATFTVNGFGLDNYGTAIFDSTPSGPNDPGPDMDLLVGLGNILILQENGQQTGDFFNIPDDAQLGGAMVFNFVGSVELQSVDLIDICPGPPVPQTVVLTLTDGSGNTRTYVVPGGWTEDLVVDGPPGFGTLNLQTLTDQPGVSATATASEDAGFDRHDVVSLSASFASSGALDNLVFCQEN